MTQKLGQISKIRPR